MNERQGEGQPVTGTAAQPMGKNAGSNGGAANGSSSAPSLDAGKTNSAATVKPTVSHMLGELTWLLSQSPTHKHFAIGDLEWMVMPAILLEQFRVFHGPQSPVGFALWANYGQIFQKKQKHDLKNRSKQGAARGCGPMIGAPATGSG